MLLGNNSSGNRVKAEPKMVGILCPECQEELIAKCGEIKIWHWAHKSVSECEYSKRGETDWHLAHKQWWLDKGANIEVPVGNRRADVIYKNTIIEFQRSNDTMSELIDRTNNHICNKFSVIWVFPKSLEDREDDIANFKGSQSILGGMADAFCGKNMVIIIEDTNWNEWVYIVSFVVDTNSKIIIKKVSQEDIMGMIDKESLEKLFISERYPLSKTMPFGKYSGREIKKLPKGYKKWLWKNVPVYGELAEGLKDTILSNMIRKYEVDDKEAYEMVCESFGEPASREIRDWFTNQ